MSFNKKLKVLGIAASLRNARWGKGSYDLVEKICTFEDKEALFNYLATESELHLENFLAAGRKDGKDFLDIYDNLKKLTGDKGLSNSEVALAAALWAAEKEGVEIEHTSLPEFFTASGKVRNSNKLKNLLMEADGVIVSGPVYFGDRGSLAESLIEFIANDEELKENMQGKIYAGIAVGAKRNGGQETTLIYQMLDMMNLGMLGVGNDSDTTSQYGGTGHAGDVGTMHNDKYGLETSMGVGRRVARVIKHFDSGYTLTDVLKVLFIVLQDSGGIAQKGIDCIISSLGVSVETTVLDIVNKKVKRCIACDICPTHINVDQEYRCVIKSGGDDFDALHMELLDYDVLVPVVVSKRNKIEIKTNYQAFIERTRYLRRGDYVFSDLMVSPLVIEEVGADGAYGIRMVTSFVRHHTVVSRPMTIYLLDSNFINKSQIVTDFSKVVKMATSLSAGRIADSSVNHTTKYNPVGYVLSANKDLEDERLFRRKKMMEARMENLTQQANNRLERAD